MSEDYEKPSQALADWLKSSFAGPPSSSCRSPMRICSQAISTGSSPAPATTTTVANALIDGSAATRGGKAMIAGKTFKLRLTTMPAVRSTRWLGRINPTNEKNILSIKTKEEIERAKRHAEVVLEGLE